MTITDASTYFGLIAGATPVGTNIANNVQIGESLVRTSFTDADIAYSFKVAGNAAADVATLTLSSGAVAQTVGTPVITDGDTKDFEGVALPTAVTIYAIAVICTTADTSGLTVGGSKPHIAGEINAINDTLQLVKPAGFGPGSDTVTLTFGTGDGVAEVTVLAKTT